MQVKKTELHLGLDLWPQTSDPGQVPGGIVFMPIDSTRQTRMGNRAQGTKACNTAMNHRPLGVSKAPATPPRTPRSSRPPLMAANIDTVVKPTPIHEDEIELIEESGLLRLDEDSPSDNSKNNTEHIVELTQSILIDDVEGNPAKHSLAPENLDHSIEVVDEILEEEDISEADLSSVETRGEIGSGAKRGPRDTAVIAASAVVASVASVPNLHEQAVASGMAQYSDGVPSHELASQATVAVQKHKPASYRKYLPAIVFFAGIAAGVALFLGFRKSSEAVVATPAAVRSQPVPAAVAPVVQPLRSGPTVAPLVEPTTAAQAPAPAPPSPEELARLEAERLQIEETEKIAEAAKRVEEQAVAQQALADASAKAEEEAKAATLALAENAKRTATRKEQAEVAALKAEAAAAAANAALLKAEAVAAAKAAKDAEAAMMAAKATDVVVTPLPTPKKKSSRSKKAAPTTAVTKPKATKAPGTLMLGAKPPSAIFVDGKKTGLTTPQRNLSLSPGKHRITLVNREHKVKDSFTVTIRSGQKTRTIRDFTNKIK